MPIISDAVCNAPDYYDNQITTNMFCAGYEKGGIDACQVSFFASLCVLVHKSSFSVPSHSFVLFDLIINRGTAAVLLWRRTVCQRPAGIVCSEL